MLLVLDNCEHVIEDCARLVDSILSSCIGITVLATSREPLRVTGEAVWRLNPLQVPNPEGPIEMNELARCEAVQLFVDRANLVAPDFELSFDNGMQVAGLCSSLDGLPLAIELAAARVGLMALDQILNRLKDRFGLLTGGSRTGPARHRTLQAAIDWSHELLSTDERELFRRSSVFADSFNLEAAESVCCGDGLQPAAIADLLAGLVDKSLVIATGNAQHPVRFRMLETLRQYARARLRDSDEEEMYHRRQAEHFVELVEAENPAETVRRSAAWRILIADDYPNIIAAIAWAATADTELLLRLVAPMGAYWVSSGYTGEGIQWISTALARPSKNSRARLMCQMYAAWLSWLGGDMAAAHSWARDLEAEQGVVDDRRLESRAMHVRGLVASFGDGDYALGTELFNHALAMAREAGDRQGMAETLDSLGATTIFMGDLTTARRYLQEGLTLSMSLGYHNGISLAQCFLGGLDFLEGNLQVAEQRLVKAIRLGLASHYRWVVATSLDILSWVVVRQGDDRRGLLLSGAAESAYRWAQVDRSISVRRLYEANVLPAIERHGPDAPGLLEQGRLMAVDSAVDFAVRGI
jgi:non-specific serine/threonine protein kinase